MHNSRDMNASTAAALRTPPLFPMKRKIAAILAADVAGYSRLVAEDEERTLTDRIRGAATLVAAGVSH